jgi:hypothetical protein
MKEKFKCEYEKCKNSGYTFIDTLDGKRYHFICWLLSMNIDLNKVTFDITASKKHYKINKKL